MIVMGTPAEAQIKDETGFAGDIVVVLLSSTAAKETDQGDPTFLTTTDPSTNHFFILRDDRPR